MSAPTLRPWVIFDADNTLWDVEALYDYARKQLGELLAEYDTENRSAKDIEELQDRRDHEIEAVYGYSSDRYARSFEDCVLRILGKNDVTDLKADEVELVVTARDLARTVFERRAEPYDHILDVFRLVREKGYELGIFTAGEAWVQERRLEQSSFVALCSGFKVVPRKDEDELRAFCDEKDIDVSKSWLIGDSLRSDIGPGNLVGMETVHIPNPNWKQTEKDDYVQAAHTINALTDLPDLLPDLSAFPAELQPAKRRIHLIFEGGGAKGLAHVGALKALEECDLDIDRIAGSSAGAIMAALLACGYRADDLFKDNGDETITGVLSEDFTNHLGKWQWCAWKLLTPFGGVWPPKNWLFLLTFWIRWPILGLLVQIRRKGFLNASAFVDWLDGLLRSRITADGRSLQGVRVTFNDMGRDAPHIVVSDISNQTVRVLTWREQPQSDADRRINEMPIAEAVAASAAIPFAFEYRSLPIQEGKKNVTVDGGMLSNFPAWIFGDDRDERSKRIPIIGFALTDANPEQVSVKWLWSYIAAIARTVVSGVRMMEIRNIEDLYVIPLKVNVDTLQFDMSPKTKIQTYNEGRNAVRTFLSDPTTSKAAWELADPAWMEQILDLVRLEFLDILRRRTYKKLQSAMPTPKHRPHLRANIMRLTNLGRLRIAFAVNMKGDTDDDLELSGEGGGTGLALKTASIVVTDLEDARYGYSKYHMTKYQQALVRRSLKSLVSIPLIDDRGSDPRTIGVLNFDSDDDLLDCLKDEEVESDIKQLGDTVVGLWRMCAKSAN